MKCFKQLKAFKSFKDGHAQKIELSLISERSSYCFVKAAVLPSMRQDRVYKTWISVVKETAKVFSAKKPRLAAVPSDGKYKACATLPNSALSHLLDGLRIVNPRCALFTVGANCFLRSRNFK